MDYRSHVSGAQNTAFKVILFLFLFLYFSIPVYAVSVSDLTKFYSPIYGFTWTNPNFVFSDYYASEKSRATYVVPISNLPDNKLYFSSSSNKKYTVTFCASDDGSLLDGASSTVSGSGLVTNFPYFTVSSSFYTFDVSSYQNYDFLYISVYENNNSGFDLSAFRMGSFAVVSTPLPVVTPSPVPTSSPGITPNPVPSVNPDSDNLEDYIFWATCFDKTWKNGFVANGDIKQRFVPSSVTDLTDLNTGIHNYVFTYPVRIPFFVQTSFFGEGFFDANFSFDFSLSIQGMKLDGTDGISYLVDNSTPYIQSVDSLSFNAVGDSKYGFGFDVFNVPLHSGTSAEFYYCTDIYVSLYTNHQFTGYGDYIDVNLSNVTFKILSSIKISDLPSDKILNDINNNVIKGNEQDKQFHEEEIEEANKAIGELNSGLEQITGTLNSWEIVTMPVTVVQDLVEALRSDGSTGLTFPSVTIMGQELWPDYTFDLQVIAEQFPVLYNSLHIISGILIVGGFLHYLWRKWHILTGDDTPEE